MTSPPRSPRDADVVLRPCTEAGRDVTGQPPGDERATVGFVVERAGRVAGRVAVTKVLDDVGELSWTITADHRGVGAGIRAVRLLVAYCFDDLGLTRVEARIEPGDVPSLRLAARAGLRREGLLRGGTVHAGRRRDDVLLARLASDPAPDRPEGFRAVLNAALPTKRVIAQGVLRDQGGRVLLCELTYKHDWDLPGGVVEPGESPLDTVVREVDEELGVRVSAGSLLAVDWLPPWAGWDDACLLVFDLGVIDASLTDSMVLERREIAAVHWCGPDDVARYARAPTADRIAQAVSAGSSGRTGDARALFLHDGQVPPPLSLG